MRSPIITMVLALLAAGVAAQEPCVLQEPPLPAWLTSSTDKVSRNVMKDRERERGKIAREYQVELRVIETIWAGGSSEANVQGMHLGKRNKGTRVQVNEAVWLVTWDRLTMLAEHGGATPKRIYLRCSGKACIELAPCSYRAKFQTVLRGPERRAQQQLVLPIYFGDQRQNIVYDVYAWKPNWEIH